MTTAFLFAGQAAEEPGMGRALLDDPAAAPVVARASDALGLDLARLLRRGGRELDDPVVAQTLAATLGAAAAAGLAARGVVPDACAGHSLGELPAWGAAGGPAPEVVVELAVTRARILAATARDAPGGLLALTVPSGFDPDQRGAVLDALPAAGLALAADNAHAELVVSGPLPALEALRARFGGRVLVRSGPWHHPAMAPAVAPWAAALAATPAGPARGLWSSVRAARLDDDPRAALAEALIRPVRWRETLAALAAAGVDRVVLPGLARTLRGLLRLNGFPGSVWAATTPAELDAAAR